MILTQLSQRHTQAGRQLLLATRKTIRRPPNNQVVFKLKLYSLSQLDSKRPSDEIKCDNANNLCIIHAINLSLNLIASLVFYQSFISLLNHRRLFTFLQFRFLQIATKIQIINDLLCFPSSVSLRLSSAFLSNLSFLQSFPQFSPFRSPVDRAAQILVTLRCFFSPFQVQIIWIYSTILLPLFTRRHAALLSWVNFASDDSQIAQMQAISLKRRKNPLM